MVAAVLGVRLRSMRHLMAREWWRMLVLIAACIWLVTLIPGVLWARSSLYGTQVDTRTAALSALGAVFALGWALVPVLIAGGDDTLDPRRFAPFGVNVSRIMPGLVVAALITLPAIFFGFMWLWLSSSWYAEGPAVGTFALAGGLVQTLSYVALAKVCASWAARVFANRRARAVGFVIAVLGGIGFAYLAWRALHRGLEALFATDFDTLLEALARTPLVSALTAPAAAANGDWPRAWALLALGVAWTGVLLVAWRSTVAQALVTPIYRSAGLRSQPDAVVASGKWVALLSAKDRVGPAGAVYARSLRAWRSDPRYISGLAAVILLPALFVAVVIPALDLDPRWALAAPFVLAISIGWGRHNDVAYDSSALWMDIVAGSRGVAVMRGRFAAVVVWALPLVTAAAALTAGWAGHWEVAPAVVGAAVGALGASLGVSAVTSVVLPYRTPAPGENPFGAEVGSVGAGLVGQFASSVATFVLLPLVVVPCILAVAVDARWGALAAVGGVGLGAAAYLSGLTLAGRLYDDRSGRLLAAVR